MNTLFQHCSAAAKSGAQVSSPLAETRRTSPRAPHWQLSMAMTKPHPPRTSARSSTPAPALPTSWTEPPVDHHGLPTVPVRDLSVYALKGVVLTVAATPPALPADLEHGLKRLKMRKPAPLPSWPRSNGSKRPRTSSWSGRPTRGPASPRS